MPAGHQYTQSDQNIGQPLEKEKDDEDEVSKLEKEIRELKSINRSLLRRLRKIR
jgi:hypothetical protein